MDHRRAGGDDDHERVARVFQQLNVPGVALLTTNAVVFETYPLILHRSRRGRANALRFLDVMERNVLRVVRLTAAEERAATTLVRTHADKSYSLCDAASFAVMKRLRVRAAVALDEEFRSYGQFRGAAVGSVEPRHGIRPGHVDCPRNSTAAMHHFTVDVEEYFQVSALEPYVSRGSWDGFESRVRLGVARLIELLDRHRARGTFFVLGWVAERQAAMVREIAGQGHEIASHGWDHRRVTEQTPEQFRESVRRTRLALEDLAGRPVIGFRAPSFSIVPGREWALEILGEEGYRYDSSLFPIRRPGYGFPSAGRDPYWLNGARAANGKSGGMFEVPPATIRWMGQNLPAGGGAYFRLFPYALVRRAFKDAERRGVAATFYVHPWELDPEQPRLSGLPWTTQVRHYGGLARTVPRLERLLAEFRFAPICEHPELTTHAR
ncbi:MAG TPA: XrtA system polysaccharide deacetylase [Gemmatimonadales bacterium]|nr:XrtA system polysaccharide deacetylase [Gemmatimonadales bacterium]